MIMIIEHICNGSMSTVCHNFEISIDEMDINISGGKFIKNNKIVYESMDGGSLSISPRENAMYLLCVTKEGLLVLKARDLDEQIKLSVINKETIVDTLAWFDTNDDTESLEDIDFNFKIITGVSETEDKKTENEETTIEDDIVEEEPAEEVIEGVKEDEHSN